MTHAPAPAFAFTHIPPSHTTQGAADCAIIYGHGWGLDGQSFAPIASSLARFGHQYLIDFPGFGASPPPPATWGTADYAQSVAAWVLTLPYKRIIWVGHSFGCRIGLQLGAQHAALFDRMVLMAPAGLKRKRPLTLRIYMWLKVRLFKTLKVFVPEGPARDALRARFGSADYKNAGPMRPIFMKTLAEDLTETAQLATTPTLLLCGTSDTETPPEMSQRLQKLMPHARLILLDGLGHNSILTDGQHQCAAHIARFITEGQTHA